MNVRPFGAIGQCTGVSNCTSLFDGNTCGLEGLEDSPQCAPLERTLSWRGGLALSPASNEDLPWT
eukprot:1863416-Pyramimonas_sp.AAC.1